MYYDYMSLRFINDLLIKAFLLICELHIMHIIIYMTCLRPSINIITTIAILLSVINIIDLASYRKHICAYHDAFLTVINPHLNLSTCNRISFVFV